jgi:hypothetical protein
MRLTVLVTVANDRHHRHNHRDLRHRPCRLRRSLSHIRHHMPRQIPRLAQLPGFVNMLRDLPDDISDLTDARKIAANIAQDLRAAMVNDPLFGGKGTALDPGVLLTPSDGYRARISVISMIGLSSDEQRQSFVNQLQMALLRGSNATRPAPGRCEAGW